MHSGLLLLLFLLFFLYSFSDSFFFIVICLFSYRFLLSIAPEAVLLNSIAGNFNYEVEHLIRYRTYLSIQIYRYISTSYSHSFSIKSKRFQRIAFNYLSCFRPLKQTKKNTILPIGVFPIQVSLIPS